MEVYHCETDSKRMLTPKDTAKAAYPTKQVTTWEISQLLCSAGTNGWISLGFSEA